MKPIELTIKGLNSFEEEQVIHFDKLTRAGIFGIFGPTGSGKSSIIDAMTIALYDKIPRYDIKGSNKHFINSNTDTMYIRFQFAIHSEKNEFYMVERSYKKTAKTYKAVTARLSRVAEENEIISDKTIETNKKIIEILGLNYDDFTRAVIIPQGKFSEFLLLENQERRAMLERIFKLEKYGKALTEKTRIQYNMAKSESKMLTQKLDLYGDISEETVEAEKELYESEHKQLEENKALFGDRTKLYNEYKQLQELSHEHASYQKQKDVLSKQEPVIKETKKELEKIESVEKIRSTVKQQREIEIKVLEVKKQLAEKIEAHTILKENLEKVQNEYEEILKIKNEEYPLLLKRETKLEEAKNIFTNLSTLEAEREVLRQQFKNQSNSTTQLAERLKKIQNDIVCYEKELVDLAEKKKNAEYSLEYRADIENMYETEKKTAELKLDLDKLKEKNSLLIDKLKKEEMALEKNQADELQRIYNAFMLQYKSIVEEKIDMEDILQRKYLYEKNSKIKENIKKNKEMLQKIEAEKADLAYQSIQFILEEKESFKVEMENQIQALEKSQFAALCAAALQEGNDCPVCGSKTHPKKAEIVADNILMVAKQSHKSVLKEIEQLKPKVQEKLLQANSLKKDAENLKKVIDGAEEEIQGYDFEKERNEIVLLEKEVEEKNNNKEDFQKEKEKQESLLKGAEIEKATLLEGIQRSKLARKENELNMAEKENAYRICFDEHEKNKKNHDAESFGMILEEIRKKEKERNTLEKTEAKIQEMYRSELKEKGIITVEINEKQEKLNEIRVVGNEKKDMIEKLKKQLHEIIEDKNIQEELEALQKKINEILEKENQSKVDLDKIKTAEETLVKQNSVLQKETETFHTIQQENQKAIEQVLQEEHLSGIDEIETYLQMDKVAMTKKVQTYQDALNNITDNIGRLEQKLENRQVENLAEQIKALKVERDTLQESVERRTKETAVLYDSIERKKKDLVIVKQLHEERKALIKKEDILSDLASLFSGEQFVEFVARKHLKYIVRETSKRLREMTKGRYLLELDDSDFIIQDNFNGGVKRSPKTLSGGEMFMVSLCLALALSSKIQMKSNAPLELFFLDEGFGTLDENLIDTVVSTLEQLKIENLTVGVITHVEELKNRIPSKLELKPAEQGLHGTIIQYHV